MGSGKYVPKCKALGKALKDAALEWVKGGAFAGDLEMGAGKTFFQEAVLGWKRARSCPPLFAWINFDKNKR